MRGSALRPRHIGFLALSLVLPIGCTASVSDPGTVPGNPTGSGTGGSGAPTNPLGSGGTGSTVTPTPGSGGTTTGSGGGGVVTPGTGGVAGGGAGAPVDTFAAACAASNNALNAGLTPARRLTRDEFNNSVRDLLGMTGTPSEGFADDERIGPFRSNAIAPVDELQVTKYSEVANRLAVAAKPNMRTISPCDLAADMGTTCATNFVTTFGQKAFRRPLDQAEVTKYVTLYGVGRTGTDGALNGFRLVVEAMLQSPFFLYHHDVGTTGRPQAGTVPVTPFELASRLSFFLWGSMPDATLFTLAANGTLAQEATINAQVQRLLADNRAATTIGMFHRQWLNIEGLPDEIKDPMVFPRYNAQITDAMMQETQLFTDAIIRKGDGLLKSLLTSNVAYPQGGLFGIYGATQPAGFTPGMPVMLPATQRAGLLTQAAFLSRWSHPTQTSPVHRGKVIRTNVMCGTILPPPADVVTTPLAPTPTTSTRERVAQHLTDSACAACHIYMDPIGLGFEHYDSIGAYRTNDGPGPVNATGNIVGAGPDLVGNFKDAVELANKLAQSQDVSNCFTSQWFRFSMGRMESPNDSCSIKGIREAFRASGGNIRDLLARIAVSPAFRNVRLSGS